MAEQQITLTPVRLAVSLAGRLAEWGGRPVGQYGGFSSCCLPVCVRRRSCGHHGMHLLCACVVQGLRAVFQCGACGHHVVYQQHVSAAYTTVRFKGITQVAPPFLFRQPCLGRSVSCAAQYVFLQRNGQHDRCRTCRQVALVEAAHVQARRMQRYGHYDVRLFLWRKRTQAQCLTEHVAHERVQGQVGGVFVPDDDPAQQPVIQPVKTQRKPRGRGGYA